MVKLVIGHKSGKTKQVDFEDNKILVGKKVGDTIKGELVELPGYELLITGGSNASGFPMRRDVDSSEKKSVLLVSGVGLRKAVRKGMRRRKTVAGNTVSPKTAQLNLSVVKEGPTPLFEAPKADEPAENAEAPSEAK